MEIKDFGEKIGGAKKDLWKERGLMIQDLQEMNDAEKDKLIKKDNIWKKPNYEELVKNGLSVRVAYFIKTIRDATPTKPNIRIFDNTAEAIQERQEGYISFVTQLRDCVMNITTDDEILKFYANFMEKYTIKKPYSNLVEISPKAFGCIDNKLLKASQVFNLKFLDGDIRKKKFCYTDDEKILSDFTILCYDNDNVKFSKDYSNRNLIEIKHEYGKTFIYPSEGYNNPNNWKDNTFFIIQKGRIINNNIENIEKAKQYILSNFREGKTKAKTTKTRKKGFVPKQLERVLRTGDDYRKGKNITGEDMMEKFNFKGGEFGNWLSDNERQYVLNYGYDALLDLSKALSISPKDISLGNRLSIAFGSRGSGNALAHYEPDREVINLTKMKGAGSLAHEWGHALDNIVGKKLGYKGFYTESIKYYDTKPDLMRDIIDTMKYKIVNNEETLQKQKNEYDKHISRVKDYINTFFPPTLLNDEEIKIKDKLIQNIVDNAEKSRETLSDYLINGSGNKDIDDLSKLRIEILGTSIKKEERINIAHLQKRIIFYKENIGKPAKIETNFYKNSIEFDSRYSKTDNGYWQSTAEMFARAFACYVSDKLDYKSDYLCGHAESNSDMILNEKGELELIKAYPEGEERKLINEKIDKFIEYLKEKEILHDYNFEKNIEEQEEYSYDY